jgi:hypothetical protein
MVSPVFPSLSKTLSHLASFESKLGSGWHSFIRFHTSSGSSFSMSG